MKFILGRKIEMTQVFDEKGNVIPVTIISAGPCFVTQIKTSEGKDKYESIQIGFEELKKQKITKSKKTKPYKYLREYRESKAEEKKSKKEEQELKIGDKIDVSVFEEGEKVKVSGMSKGKGFMGIIKRHRFKRKPASHGTKHSERAMGSVGSAYPQRVIKGRKMPGRMGYERIAVKNLKIAKIDKENNLLAIKGAIPGRRGALLEIRV
ncbi:MAG: 50S ribosomal protein L3 [Candidatus Nealsonbacteria bacterium]